LNPPGLPDKWTSGRKTLVPSVANQNFLAA
jgi:hypothetical protein